MNILHYYKIDECVLWILENKFEKVALQFPESLFINVTSVLTQLKLKLPLVNFVVLADAKYGSCCVDEIACEHAQVSGVIHFGHACLSQISGQNLKVKYVFGNGNFDENKLDSYLGGRLAENDQIILFVDVVYLHALAKIKVCVEKYCSSIFCPKIILPNNLNNSGHWATEISSCCPNKSIKCSNNINTSNNCHTNLIRIENDLHDNLNLNCAEDCRKENESSNEELNTHVLYNLRKDLPNKFLCDNKLKECSGKADVDLDSKTDNLSGHCIGNEFDVLHETNVIFDSCKDSNISTNNFVKFGRLFELSPSTKLSDYTIIYIGTENQFLTVFMMTFSDCKFLVFDPKMENLNNTSSNINKMLMKRYYLLEKARDSKFIGILIGTLNVSYYTSIVNKLKQVIKRAGKKSRIYAPGTPNVAKLANVSEFDIFVAVACPENSLIDCADYLQPIVTPFEMILACQVDFNWSGKYEVDFPKLCQLADDALKSNFIDNTTDISLVSGKMINFEDVFPQFDSNGQQLVAQNQSLILSESYLNERTFQGLDPQLGETPVKKFITGTTGFAMGYTHEPTL